MRGEVVHGRTCSLRIFDIDEETGVSLLNKPNGKVTKGSFRLVSSEQNIVIKQKTF